MKHLLLLLVLGAIVFAQSSGPTGSTPSSTTGQSGFNGTWKMNTSKSDLGQNPTTYSLDNGVYQCNGCVVHDPIKADGQQHPISDAPFDTVAVSAPDNNTIRKVGQKGGKQVLMQTETVSADGNTMTVERTFITENGQQVTANLKQTRIGAAPASGKHMVNGQWKVQQFNTSDNGAVFTLKDDGQSLTMTSPTGATFTAKFDGNDYPYKGDSSIDAVSLRRVDASTIEETDKLKGKPVGWSRFQVQPDGKTIVTEFKDLSNPNNPNATGKIIAERQQ